MDFVIKLTGYMLACFLFTGLSYLTGFESTIICMLSLIFIEILDLTTNKNGK